MRDSMQKILVIDGDECLRDAIGVMLEREGYTPLYAVDGKEGFEKALALDPNLLVVDLALPGMSGFEVCRQLRKANVQTPIIIVSAICDEREKVLLLETGADDYIVKPFGSRELLARIRAVLRRSSGDAPKFPRFKDIEIDVGRRTVTCCGVEVRLTPKEYSLLVFFRQNADRVLTRDVIMRSVWGDVPNPDSRTVDAHIVKLRKKLEAQPGTRRRVVTVHTLGYRFLL
jgi:two-component system response regulator RegX3